MHRLLAHGLRYQHRFRHSLSFALHRSELVSVRLLWLLLTSRSGPVPLPFQALCEISPGKNALLHRTTAEFTLSCLDHESFAETCPLTLLNSALYPVLVHRLTIYAPRFLPTLGHPYAVALHFICCDQLMAGLTPAGVRPCRAHTKKASRSNLLAGDSILCGFRVAANALAA